MATCLRIMIVLLLTGSGVKARQQEEESPAYSNDLELVTAANMSTEDDATWQQLNSYRRHALGLNAATEEDLQALGFLTPLQIDNLLQYRTALGPLISLYELQAIPGFDMEVIKKLLPYVSLNDQLGPQYSLKDYFSKGDHSLLLRYGRKAEAGKGYNTGKYSGSPDKMFFRYRYTFSKYLSTGMTIEKDAGERWLVKKGGLLFDFTSIHIFLKNYYRLKALAIGDFTVNMGQGLLTWQSHAYSKGAGAMMIKREGDVLKPYTSSGEVYFFRGVGITYQLNNFHLTFFGSLRKLDAAIDSADIETPLAGSIGTSGYHRTASELANKGSVNLLTVGGAIKYQRQRWHVGLNIIRHDFSPPLYKVQQPYNQFDFTGKNLIGASTDFAAYWKNVHFFGEWAASNNLATALVIGGLTTIAPTVDLSFAYRSYSKDYHGFFTNSFGNYYQTANETGCYAGMALRMGKMLTIESFIDLYRSPWLRYRKNAPSNGAEYAVSGTYSPDKLTQYRLRCSYQVTRQNETINSNPIPVLGTITKMNVRFECSKELGKTFKAKARAEYCLLQTGADQKGLMGFVEIGKGFRKFPVSIIARGAYFRTSSYDSRIYATESSVLYENAVSQFYGTGWQYYLNLKWKVNRRLSCWGRIHQTIYPGLQEVGSGNDEISGNRVTSVQFQLQYLFAQRR